MIDQSLAIGSLNKLGCRGALDHDRLASVDSWQHLDLLHSTTSITGLLICCKLYRLSRSCGLSTNLVDHNLLAIDSLQDLLLALCALQHLKTKKLVTLVKLWAPVGKRQEVSIASNSDLQRKFR